LEKPSLLSGDKVKLKASGFDFCRELKFRPEEGITTFRNSRILIFDANAMGLLRQNLIVELGLEKAREFFLRFGYQNGFSDYRQVKLSCEYKSEEELLSLGPIMHTWEGVVKANPTELHFDRQSGEFRFTGIWKNSYEAEQHKIFNTMAQEPVCWSLAGYAAGWSTAFFGSPLVAIEPHCVGMGHEHCEWLIQPPRAFGAEALPYIEALKIFWADSES
jgi:predicted hydrocarbon binding protein